MKKGPDRRVAPAPRISRRESRLQQSRGGTPPVHVGTVLAEFVDALAVLTADLWLEGRLDAFPVLDESSELDD